MFSRALKIMSGGLVMIIGLQCGHSQTVVTGLKQDQRAVIDFPKPFERDDPAIGKHIVISDDYEIRRLSDSGNKELLFAMDDYGKLSDNLFGVTLDGQFKVRAARADEWSRAERLPTKRFDARAHETKVSGDSVQYRDRLFKKSGQSFETIVALASPNGRWLAVFSHTSEKDLPSYGVMGGGGRGKGEMFVDVYDASSGHKIFSAHAPHRGGDQPSRYFDATLWVNNDYLVVPLDVDPNAQIPSAGNRVLLAIMPK